MMQPVITARRCYTSPKKFQGWYYNRIHIWQQEPGHWLPKMSNLEQPARSSVILIFVLVLNSKESLLEKADFGLCPKRG